MKIGILCAGDGELSPFLPMIEGDSVQEKAMLTVHTGYIEGVAVAALYSGVCRVNAAIAAQVLIDVFDCTAIVSAGTAGGMDARLGLLDTVVAVEAAYHDLDEGILTGYHPWLESVWFKADDCLLAAAHEAVQSTKQQVYFGRMVTGEHFITDAGRDEINARFAPLTVDMETAGIAHVCHVNCVPFIAVRTVTDTAAHSGTEVFAQNCDAASAQSAEFVRRMLRVLCD